MQSKKKNKSDFPERLKTARFTLRLTQDEMGKRLDVSGNYIYLLESGQNTPGPKLVGRVEEIEADLDAKAKAKLMRSLAASPGGLRGDKVNHRAPVVSWATAGVGGNFDDLANQIDEWLDTDCKDPNSYALIIEGDSMVPKFEPGDRVIFMPNVEPQNGDVVVARLEDSGDVYFKLYHSMGPKSDTIRLTSYNQAYPPLEFNKKAFRFIHPMFEMRRMRRK